MSNDKHKTLEDDLSALTILWLDYGINTNEDNRNAQQQLNTIVGSLLTFEDQYECEKYIRSVPPEQRCVLIVSGRLGRELVPRIHHFQQISSIYIYCQDKHANKHWSKQFAKVKGVVVSFKELISQMQSNHKSSTSVEKSSSIKSSTSNDVADQSTAIFNYLDSPIDFIECFLRIQPSETEKGQFIAHLMKEYENNAAELALIREFQHTYSSEKAIWWYSRDSFLCKILCRALKEANIYTLFLSRFLIRDIHRHLKQHQCQSPIRVYRGQYMSDNELEKLKTSIDGTFARNIFFFTTYNRQTALSFIQASSTHAKKVLFEIDADPRVATVKPFADISSHSYSPGEGEILFMAGSRFRINDIHHGHHHIWIVRATLSAGNEHDWKEFFKYTQKVHDHDGGLHIYSFGKILCQMSKFDAAEKYYHRLLDEIVLDKTILGHVYNGLGHIASCKGNPNESHRWHQKFLEIKMGTVPVSDGKTAHSNVHAQFHKTDSMVGSPPPNKTSSVVIAPNEVKTTNNRFTDVVAERHEILLPIEGYEKQPLVSLEEAVLPLVPMLPDIRRKAYVAKLKCTQPADGLTPDESASIMLYTMEWEPHDQCLYFVLNRTLRNAERKLLKPWFLYLKLILTALSRLPSVSRTVWRGVRLDQSAQHRTNVKFFWWAFTSCTTTMNTLKSDQYLGNTGTRTLFAIECTSGKDIRRHSYYKKEEEVLLLPATQFQVISCLPIPPDVHIIQLKETMPEFPFLQPVA